MTLDPSDPFSTRCTELILVCLGNARRCHSKAVKDGLATVRRRGGRTTAHAPYGYRWVQTGYDRSSKRKIWMMVPDENERSLMAKALRLHLQNRTLDQIRQVFAYDLKARNRAGNEFGNESMRQIIIAAKRLQADDGDDAVILPIARADETGRTDRRPRRGRS